MHFFIVNSLLIINPGKFMSKMAMISHFLGKVTGNDWFSSVHSIYPRDIDFNDTSLTIHT